MFKITTEFRFTDEEAKKVKLRYGDDYYNKVIRDIQTASARWKLSEIKFIPYYSINCVFTCISELYGPCVLKTGNPVITLDTEYYTLIEYIGRRFCKVFDVELKNGILIEERIQPGKSLLEEKSLEKRLSVFCDLFDGLHITPVESQRFPTYVEEIRRLTDYVGGRSDCSELAFHMKKAEELCTALTLAYPAKKLLHGDLHHENILTDNQGGYKIIDPKGVLGDPIFDLGQFLLNEYDEVKTGDTFCKINRILDVFEEKLVIPQETLRKCLYIQTALNACWDAEDGPAPALDGVLFAEKVLLNKFTD